VATDEGRAGERVQDSLAAGCLQNGRPASAEMGGDTHWKLYDYSIGLEESSLLITVREYHA
jgi:hypothetical protein